MLKKYTKKILYYRGWGSNCYTPILLHFTSHSLLLYSTIIFFQLRKIITLLTQNTNVNIQNLFLRIIKIPSKVFQSKNHKKLGTKSKWKNTKNKSVPCQSFLIHRFVFLAAGANSLPNWASHRWHFLMLIAYLSF